MMTSSKK